MLTLSDKELRKFDTLRHFIYTKKLTVNLELVPAMLVPWRCRSAWLPYAFRLFASQPLQSANRCWQVSSHGRCRDTRGGLSFGSPHPSGYRYVFIAGRRWPVHRVVILTFHGLPPSQQAWQVHHRDGNKANNRLDNLEYVTPSQNASYSFESRFRQDGGPKRSKPVLWRVVGFQSWTLCPSIKLAAERLGISRFTVWKCCHFNTSARGMEFRFQHLDMQIFGEEWRPMLDPTSGQKVPKRMVSSLGRITTQSGLVHYGYLNPAGYFVTGVSFDRTRRTERVHRLVAFGFLGPPPTPKHNCVNHKDGNKSNNALENLEWVTHAENSNHYFSNVGASPTARGGKPIWSRPYCSKKGWNWHPSILEAAIALGAHSTSISKCLHGHQKQAADYEFRPADPQCITSLPGEVWQDIDLKVLLKDRALRKQFVR